MTSHEKLDTFSPEDVGDFRVHLTVGVFVNLASLFLLSYSTALARTFAKFHDQL